MRIGRLHINATSYPFDRRWIHFGISRAFEIHGVHIWAQCIAKRVGLLMIGIRPR